MPMAAAAIPMAAGLIGGVAASQTNVGKNTNHPTPLIKSDAYDDRRYQFGGSGEQNAAANALARDQAQRQNDVGMRGNVDGLQGQQQQSLDMLRARAMGQVPSIAQQSTQQSMGQLASQQGAMAASARGPAALALAQQQAAGNIAHGQQNLAGQGAIAAAQERLAAEGAYAGGTANAYNAQQARNDQMQQFYGNQQYRSLEDQQRSNLMQQQLMAGSENTNNQILAQTNQNNANNERKNLDMMLGGMSGGAGGAMSLAGK